MIKKTFKTTLICFNPQKKISLNKINKKIQSSINSNDIKFFNTVTKSKMAAPGTSKLYHLAFFKKFKARRILMLGVYHGVDLKLMSYYNKNSLLTGVDRFTSKFCEDWPKEKRSLSWEKAGYGPQPGRPNEILAFIRKIKLNNNNKIKLIKSDDKKYLNFLIKKKYKFDLIYIDTSHDFKTVLRQINQSKKIISKKGIISGDDYSDHGTWGVKKAVALSFKCHYVFENRIWYMPFTK